MGGTIVANINTTPPPIDDDRISELPDVIAHHILSFLVDSPKELIRTSVLSKKWLALTASFPILDFTFKSFNRAIGPSGGPNAPKYVKDKFFNYVGYTTSRFSQQQNVVSANTFKLFAVLRDPAHASIIDRCLGLILKQGLQVFVVFNLGMPIFFDDHQPPPMYRLPGELLSVSSLTSLSIHNCELPSSLIVDDDVVKFKLLKLLDLEGVYLNEEMIRCLTAGCPLLEKFNVICCYGFKRLRVYGLQSLQNVRVYYMSPVEEIDIQAPNLVHIELLDMSAREKPPRVNLFSCQKLTMIFSRCFSKLFAVSLSNFPFLETLILKLPSNYRNFELSSHSLRKLSLETESDLDEIQIDTPNLLFFLYYASESYVHGPMGDSGESKTCMDCFRDFDVETSWLQKFRRFLGRTVPFKVLRLHFFANFVDVEELKLLGLPSFELEHIELDLNVNGVSELSEYLSVVDAVLWCCRPRSLTLKSDFCDYLERQDHIVKFTYERLLEQEDQGQTNIQIVFSTDKAFGSNCSLITFLKEEVNQEAG
uniref:uncharacterized protein LOC122605611 n=1 Tax=Erigeron canadensis TaxID=72917 RepID=UPI001CB91B38|nr:uncharacterized protein LOC122605611 [Erigeron canadensis]